MKFMKGLRVIQVTMRFMNDMSDDNLPSLNDMWGMWLICEVLTSVSERFIMIKKEYMCDCEWLWGYVFVNDWEGEWTMVSIGQKTMNIKRGSMNMSVCVYIMSIIVYVVNLSIYIVSMSVYGVNVSEHEWFWLWAWAINKLECSKRFLNLGQLWLWGTISIV